MKTLYLYELRQLVRDRRTIIFSIVLPVVVLPIFFFISHYAESRHEKRQEQTVFEYAVTGTEAALARSLIADYDALPPPAAAPDDEAAERPKTVVERTDDSREEGPAAAGRAHLQLHETEVDDPAAALEDQKLAFYFRAMTAAEAAAVRAAEPEDEDANEDAEASEAVADGGDETGNENKNEDETAEPRLDLPVLRLVYRADWDASQTAAREMERRLRRVQAERRWDDLRAHGLTIEAADVAPLDETDLATAGQVTGRSLGRFATVFLLLFVLTGGSVVAADTIAGEKERGTLETLLTTAVSRREIVLAKLAVVVTVGVFIALVQLVNLLVYVQLHVIELPESFDVDISIGTAALLLVLFIPLILIAASLLLWLSGRVKTYKEFQTLFMPVFLLALVPAAASVLPGLSLRSAIVLVPIANLSVAVREVLVGQVDALMLPIAWLVSMAAAGLALRAALATLSTERLITAAEIDRSELHGGPELFPRRVGRWFAVMWALIFIAGLNFPGLGMRGQLAVNLLVIFLGGSLLMIRTYRLDPRQALALRAPKIGVWPLVLLGAPASFVSGLAVARLSGLLFPTPERLLERLSNSLAPPDMPLAQLLVWIAVLPGICEEIAFRGMLLHGLRRRFHPAVLCLVVGLVFGFFHFDLIRIFPVAFLGVVVAALTLITGSIFPAMLWHALYNTTAIVISRSEIAAGQLPDWQLAAGVALLIVVFAVLWRLRTPYPDLRPSPRSAGDADVAPTSTAG